MGSVKYWTACILMFLCYTINASNYSGVPLGMLNNAELGISGNVFIANSSVIYIKDFSFQKQQNEEKIYFALSSKNNIIPIRIVFKEILNVRTKESAIHPIEAVLSNEIKNTQLYAFLPVEISLTQFTTFGVFSLKPWKYLADVKLNKKAPKPYCCFTNADDSNAGIIGNHYNAHTGPIEIQDSKTIVLKDFVLDGIKAPDAWIFAGNGSALITRSSGNKLMVLGHDTPNKQCSLKEFYKGDRNLSARLLHNRDIYDINFISIFCYKYDVDFGHIKFSLNPDINSVPLFIPPLWNNNDDYNPQC